MKQSHKTLLLWVLLILMFLAIWQFLQADGAKAAAPSTYHGPHNNGYLDEELTWLREAGFVDVDCFWKFTTIVVYGGFKP